MSSEKISEDEIEMCVTALNTKFGIAHTGILNELRKKYILYNKIDIDNDCNISDDKYNEAIDKPFRELDEIGNTLNYPETIEKIKGITENTTDEEELKYLNEVRDKIIKFNKKMAEADIDPKDHVNNISELLKLINSKLGINDETDSTMSALTSPDASSIGSPNSIETDESSFGSPNSSKTDGSLTNVSKISSNGSSVGTTNFNLDPKVGSDQIIGFIDPLAGNYKKKGKSKKKGGKKSKKGGKKSKKNQTKSKRRQRKSNKRR